MADRVREADQERAGQPRVEQVDERGVVQGAARGGQAGLTGWRWPPAPACSPGRPTLPGPSAPPGTAGVGATCANAETIASGSRVNSTERNTAVPRVPPIWRKNVADDVATPMSLGGTAFWIARTSVCMLNPRPRPNRKANESTAHDRGVGVDPGQQQHAGDQQHHADDREDPVATGAGDGLTRSHRPDHDAEHHRHQQQAGLGGGVALDDLQVQRQGGQAAEHPHADDEVQHRTDAERAAAEQTQGQQRVLADPVLGPQEARRSRSRRRRRRSATVRWPSPTRGPARPRSAAAPGRRSSIRAPG